MLGRLGQFRAFLSSLGSLKSQKPMGVQDGGLAKKLQWLTDFVIRSEDEQQFRAYQQTQSQIGLNDVLAQIYHHSLISAEQVVCIIRFYTFLLTNCSHELVIWKIVSEPLVIELTALRLQKEGEVNAQQVQQVNVYRIALIKAYVSTLDLESIKYMIVGEQLPILDNCIQSYCAYQSMAGRVAFGVETTCLANCILIILRRVNGHSELAAIVYGSGLSRLICSTLAKIESILEGLLGGEHVDEEASETVESSSLFLVDLLGENHSPTSREEMIGKCGSEVGKLMQRFVGIADRISSAQTQNDPYRLCLAAARVVFKLLMSYHREEETTSIVGQRIGGIIDRILASSKVGSGLQDMPLFATTFCAGIDLVARFMSSAACTVANRKGAPNCAGETVFAKLDSLLQLILDHPQLLSSLCLKSVKFLLYSMFRVSLTLKEDLLRTYNVLQLHMRCADIFRGVLAINANWDYIVMHYESFMKAACAGLLSVDSSDPLEYSFCTSHRARSPPAEEAVRNCIAIYETVRNFRFMMVSQTSIDPHCIKLEKIYHQNFMTPGWKLEPGTKAGEGIIVICQLLLHSNETKIPAVVIEDEECLIFALRPNEGSKVLLNIRYKNIDGFVPEKQIIVVKLKGVQQIVVEPSGKEATNKFKEYLVKWRDRSRQKQLTFIRHYINLYSQDVANLIHKIGQEQVRGGKEEQLISQAKEEQCPAQTQRYSENQQAETRKEDHSNHQEAVLKSPQSDGEQNGTKQGGKSGKQDGEKQGAKSQDQNGERQGGISEKQDRDEQRQQEAD